MKRKLQAIQRKLMLFALALGLGRTAQADNAGMALIPGGYYVQGDVADANYEGDAPTYSVYVSPFCMDTNLVSYSQWQSVYDWGISHGYHFSNAGSAPGRSNPVANVNWSDAALWCNARSQLAGFTPCYYTDTKFAQVYTNGSIELTTANVNWATNGYRLPTEAEWEKAARGGYFGGRFPWGSTINQTNALYTTYLITEPYDKAPYNTPTSTTNVGSYQTNGFGLLDMAGNVREWCWDLYSSTYYGSTTNNPKGPASGLGRVIRGGSYLDTANLLCVAARNQGQPLTAEPYIGFRCVTSNTNLPAASGNPGVVGVSTMPQINIYYGVSISNYFTANPGIIVITNTSNQSVSGTFAFDITTDAPPVGTYSEPFIWAPSAANAYLNITSSVPVTVLQTTPDVLTNPIASAITVGQSLINSSLTSGNVINPYNSNSIGGNWTFSNTNIIPVVQPGHTTVSEKVTFTPADTADYTNVTTNVIVQVDSATNATTNLFVFVLPTANPISYGQSLSNATLNGGIFTNSSGMPVTIPDLTWTFLNQTNEPFAGTNYVLVSCTPGGNYSPVHITTTVPVAVSQTTPALTLPTELTITNTLMLTYALSSSVTETNPNNHIAVSGWWMLYPTNQTLSSGIVNSNVSVTFTPADTNDYTIVTTNLTVYVNTNINNTIVLRGSLTAPDIHYGQALSNSVVTGTFTNGTVTITTNTFTFINSTYEPRAGTSIWPVQFVPPDNLYTYAPLTSSVPVTVLPTIPILTRPTAGAIANGDYLADAPLSGGTATNLFSHTNVPGTFRFSSPTTQPIISQNQYVTFTPADTLDYATATTNDVSVTVNPSVANPKGYTLESITATEITYGQSVSSSTATATFSHGGKTTTVNSSAFLNRGYAPLAGNADVSVAFTLSSTNTFTTNVTVTALKATPVLTAPTATPITAGQALTNSSLSGGTAANANIANSLVAGTFAFTTPSQVIANSPGTSTNVSVTFTPTDTSDYNPAPIKVLLTVNPANLQTNTLAFNPSVTNLNYGTTTNLTAATAVGTPVFTANPTNIAIITQNTNLVIKGVGNFTVTAIVPQITVGTNTYLPTNVVVPFTALPAALTITANNTNRVFGQANPAFTIKSYSGFVNGDTNSGVFTGAPALTTTATTTSLPGSYLITTNNAGWPWKGGVTNYALTFDPGTLTVMATTNLQAIQFLTAYNQTNLLYGTNLSLTATSVPPGAVFTFAITNSPQTNIATINPATTNVLHVRGVGAFTVTATAAAWNDSTGTNYLSATTNLSFTAVKAPLSVTVDASRTQGSTNTTFTATNYTGFVDGDNASVLSGSPLAAVTNTANSGSPAGTYTDYVLVSKGSLSATNYTFDFAPGTLTIISTNVLTVSGLTNFLGTNRLSDTEVQFLLTNNYTHPTNVNLTTLSAFLGKSIVDTNELSYILINNYARGVQVDPDNLTYLLDTNAVTTPELNAVLNNYVPVTNIVDANTLENFLRTNTVDASELSSILTSNYTAPAMVDTTTLAAFLGTDKVVDTNVLRFILMNYYQYPATVDVTTLADFLGTNSVVDTNALKYILINNYAHPSVADPLTLEDFLGDTSTNSVDTNDIMFFDAFINPSNTPVAVVFEDYLDVSGQSVDAAGLDAVLAHYNNWPIGPGFTTDQPPYLAVMNNGQTTTNFSFTITNFNFIVQFSTDLSSIYGWSNLPNSAQILFTDTNTAASAYRFYRLAPIP